MEITDKIIAAAVFWFKWSLLIGFLFFASWIGVGVFDSTQGAINMLAEGKQFKYFAIMSIPVIIGIGWFLWSVGYVPLRHFVWGYAVMVETCPSCKTTYGFKECPNCKGNKFVADQCLICGHQFDGFQRKCEECGTVGMKFRAERSFEFEDDTE